MYRKEDKKQLTMEEFTLPFGGHLRADNRWVKMAAFMPWDLIEEEYAKNMSEMEGRKALPARLAFGAIFVKEEEGLTDERTLECVVENPYIQYFVGLKEFSNEAPFDASMMVHFRKRFPTESIHKINEILYERLAPKVEELASQGKPASQQAEVSSIIGDESTATQGEGTPYASRQTRRKALLQSVKSPAKAKTKAR